jgi:hypothetical protein
MPKLIEFSSFFLQFREESSQKNKYLGECQFEDERLELAKRRLARINPTAA